MTTYGTIPTSHQPYTPTPPSNFLTSAKQTLQTTLTTRRPWSHFFSFSHLSLPSSLNDTLTRAKTNLSYFRMNYAILGLTILFCSLLWHPFSLIVFIVTLSAWLFLYFLRDTPLVVFNRNVDDRIVLGLLTVLTVVFLLFTDVTVNIVVSVAVAVVCIGVHAVVIRADELMVGDGFDDENGVVRGGGGGGGGGYSRVVGGLGERLPLKDTASASFSGSS